MCRPDPAKFSKEKEEAEDRLREKLDVEERFNKLLVQSNLQMHKIKEENALFKKRLEELEKKGQ